MPSPSLPALQKLRGLDRSSPNFHDQFNNVLYGEDYKQCVPNLDGGDLVWLLGYLDEVRRSLTLLRPPLKPA
jgi:tRNA (Thr-GGU) A37 N-methylase